MPGAATIRDDRPARIDGARPPCAAIIHPARLGLGQPAAELLDVFIGGERQRADGGRT